MMIYLHALYDGSSRKLSLPHLFKEVFELGCRDAVRKADAEAKLSAARPVLKKIAVIRGNAIAHFSASLSYDDAFRKAKLAPDELRLLTDTGIFIANVLLAERDQKPVIVWELAREDLMRMFKALEMAEEVTAP